MTRTMRDSTTAADIPLAGLDLVAGYGSGRYIWTPADWSRFRDLPKVIIDVLGTEPTRCSVLDVETGDATPDHAPEWVKARAKAIPRAYCTIYCSRDTQPAVQEAMDSASLWVGIDYQWWIATLDGTEVLPDMIGVVAVQYAGQKQTGGHYDQSVVYDDAWHASPPPAWMQDLEIRLQQLATAAQAATALVRQHM